MLTVMSYDRYVCIFKPLQYHIIMNPYMIRLLVFIGNLLPCSFALFETYLFMQIPLCRYTLDRIFCDNLSVSDLSCDNYYSQVANTFTLCGVICFVVVPVFLFILSYLKIILLVLKLSAEARKKTFATCTPHLTFFSTVLFAALFSIIFNRVNPHVPAKVAVIRVFFLSTNYILIPPLVHPLIYGIKNKDIRTALLKMKRKAISTTKRFIVQA
ncbi:olfactory receptor 2K2-like [Sardina pilchardus]|uniref:olfactory receptor 2K2-like n=1 Tax=Sardina pilchardus TaxID=27697 RepID=UPI002E0DAAED